MYVYIFEDGTTQKHKKAPTAVDKDCIEDGTLMVLKCADVKYVDENGVLDDLTECKYEDSEDGEFHYSS